MLSFKKYLENFGPAHTGGMSPPRQNPAVMATAIPVVNPKSDTTRGTDMPPDDEEQFPDEKDRVGIKRKKKRRDI